MPIIDPALDLSPDQAAISQALRALEEAMEIEISARSSADSGLGFSINDIVSGTTPVGTGQSVIETDDDLITVIDGINTTNNDQDIAISSNSTAIEQEKIDRQSDIAGLTPQISTLSSQVIDIGTQLSDEISGRVTSESSIATQISGINSALIDIQTDLSTEVSDRGSSDSSIEYQLSILQSNMSVAQAQIDRLAGIGVDPESALAAQILDLSSRTDDAETSISDEAADRTAADIDISDDVTSLTTTVTTLSTDLDDETSSRVSADTAINSTLASLTTTVSGNVATITSETAARIAADNTISSNITAIQVQADANSSSISDEVLTRAEADIDINSQLDDVQETVLGHTASIESLEFSVSGTIARYGVIVSSGDVVGTIRLDGSDASSVFQVQADKFRLSQGGFHSIPFSFDISGRTILSSCVLDSTSTVGGATITTDSVLKTGDVLNTNPFPAVSNIGVQLPPSYSFEQGGVTNNTFTGLDTITRTISHKVFTDIANLVFYGVNNTTPGNVQNRLGTDGPMIFRAEFNGSVSRNLSLWYRIKDNIGDLGTWIPFAEGDCYVPDGKREYETTSVAVNKVLTVDGLKLIEFGLAGVSLNTSQMIIPSDDMCFSGSVTIQAYNWVSGLTV